MGYPTVINAAKESITIEKQKWTKAELTIDESIQAAKEWMENPEMVIPTEVVTGLLYGLINARDSLKECIENHCPNSAVTFCSTCTPARGIISEL